MIKNIIIITLVIFVFTRMDVSMADVLNAMQSGLDKVQELLYIMKEKV